MTSEPGPRGLRGSPRGSLELFEGPTLKPRSLMGMLTSFLISKAGHNTPVPLASDCANVDTGQSQLVTLTGDART